MYHPCLLRISSLYFRIVAWCRFYSPPTASFTLFFFFNDTATTEIYTLSLHDALPICSRRFGGATCDDKSAQIYARFDKNDWRIQPAEFYRFHDAEVNTFGYF